MITEAHEHFRGGDPSAADVFGAQRPVDPACVDPAHAADAVDAGRVLFDSHALRDEGLDGAVHLLVVATQKARPLRTGEDAAVETGHGDPFGPAARPAEGLQCLLASFQVDDQGCCISLLPFVAAGTSVRTRWPVHGTVTSA